MHFLLGHGVQQKSQVSETWPNTFIEPIAKWLWILHSAWCQMFDKTYGNVNSKLVCQTFGKSEAV